MRPCPPDEDAEPLFSRRKSRQPSIFPSQDFSRPALKLLGCSHVVEKTGSLQVKASFGVQNLRIYRTHRPARLTEEDQIAVESQRVEIGVERVLTHSVIHDLNSSPLCEPFHFRHHILLRIAN